MTKFTNQIQVDSSYATSTTHVAVGDTATVAIGKLQGQVSAALDAVIETISATAHGFTSTDIGRAVYFNGTIWALARSDNADTLATQLIYDIVDVNSFKTITCGIITIADWTNVIGTTNLTAGQFYFTDYTTAGHLTATEPLAGYSNPVMQAISTTTAIVLPYRAAAVDLTNQAAQFAWFTTNQSTLDGSSRVQWNSTSISSGTAISLSSTGIISLQAGVTYEIFASYQGNSTGAAADMRVYNETAGAYIGTTMTAIGVDAGIGASSGNLLGHAFTPSVNTTISTRRSSGALNPEVGKLWLYIKAVGGSPIATQPNYSTSEQLTGQLWIDGKPVYTRTFTGTTGNTTTNTVMATITGLTKLISGVGTVIRQDGKELCVPTIGVFEVFRDGTNITSWAATSEYANKPYSFTIEYIK